MRLVLVLSLAALLSGCAAIQGLVCKLDRAALVQNAANVQQIASENQMFWDASGKPASLVDSAKARNGAAVDLAKKMAE